MKSKRKFVLAGLVLLARLTLAGCETEVEPKIQQPSGDGSGKTEPPKYIVEFNTDGGSAVDSQSVESGKVATKPEDPSLKGSWFLGWYGDKERTQEFDFSAPITVNTTVYAKWSYKLHTEPSILTNYTSPNNTGSEWTYVAFGDWPQRIKAGDVTVDETKSRKMGMFTYYLGSDGNCYVKAKENAYGFGSDYQYSDGTQAGQDETSEKWFKVEPIVWRVLTDDYCVPGENGELQSTGNDLLLAENLLTGGIPYYVYVSSRTISDATVYTNNYKYSTIRAWLNGRYESDDSQANKYAGKGFLQTAFTQSARDLIELTTVDNSAESTTDATGTLDEATDFACANTTDKIFLLSEKEATTTSYGFAGFESGAGNTRIRVTTDYAKATGAYQSSTEGYGGWWWLRSPHCDDEDIARVIRNNGDADFLHPYVSITNGGVVPALCVQLQ